MHGVVGLQRLRDRRAALLAEPVDCARARARQRCIWRPLARLHTSPPRGLCPLASAPLPPRAHATRAMATQAPQAPLRAAVPTPKGPRRALPSSTCDPRRTHQLNPPSPPYVFTAARARCTQPRREPHALRKFSVCTVRLTFSASAIAAPPFSPRSLSARTRQRSTWAPGRPPAQPPPSAPGLRPRPAQPPCARARRATWPSSHRSYPCARPCAGQTPSRTPLSARAPSCHPTRPRALPHITRAPPLHCSPRPLHAAVAVHCSLLRFSVCTVRLTF